MFSVVGADGQTYGPVSLDTLKQWCSEGRIIATTSLIAVGGGQIMRASDIHELQPYFQSGYGAPTTTYAPGPTQGQVFQQPPGQQGQVFQQPYQPSGPTPFSAPHYRGQPGAYGYQPRRRGVATALALLLGGFGVHRFYLGYGRMGMIMLGLGIACMLVCFGSPLPIYIWGWVEAVMIWRGSMRDAEGNPLE